MANSPVVSSLPAYVDQTAEPIIAKTLLGSKTAGLFTLMPNVKSEKAINEITSSVTFQDGSACGWNEAGTSTLSQRKLKTGMIKINQAFCHLKVADKYAGHQIRIAAGLETLPFEEKFVADILANVNTKLDKAIWQGDTTSSDTDLKWFDGMIKILGADSSVIDVTISSGSSYIAAVTNTLLALPDDVVDDAVTDAVIFCAPAFMRSYKQELIAANLYHYAPTEDLKEFKIPGSNVSLIAVPGLASAGKLVGGRLSNFFYGCDMEGDQNEVKLWYSNDNDEFRFKDRFNAGVQVAWPANVVLSAYTTLTSPSALNENISSIASSASATATNTGTLASNDHIYKTKEQTE